MAIEVGKDSMSDPSPTIIAERAFMAPMMKAWDIRCEVIGHKPKSKAAKNDFAAFMYGVLQMAQHTGLMTRDRASMVAFMFSVGREDTFIKLWRE